MDYNGFRGSPKLGSHGSRLSQILTKEHRGRLIPLGAEVAMKSLKDFATKYVAMISTHVLANAKALGLGTLGQIPPAHAHNFISNGLWNAKAARNTGYIAEWRAS